MINYEILKELVEKEMEHAISSYSIRDCIYTAMYTGIDISLLHMRNQISHEEQCYLLEKTKQLVTSVICEKLSKTSLN